VPLRFCEQAMWKIVFCLIAVCLAPLAAVTAQQRRVDAALSEATALLQAGRLEEAEVATRKLVTAKPRNADAHALLALVLDQRGQQVEAEQEYHAAMRIKPNLVTALSNLGVLLARTNRAAEAIAKLAEV